MNISDYCVPAAARRRAVRSVSPLSAALLGAGDTFTGGTGHVHGAAGLRGLGWQAEGAAGLVRLQVPSVLAAPAAVAKPGATNIRTQHMPMTRVSVAGGDGAPGPHPVRETA
ncbi:MAG TPA: hypothetical protein VKV80_09090 [Streptosporangiaceae bacterium]|nr:hypothetical protein [Streptosporangiaceae bacterium]